MYVRKKYSLVILCFLSMFFVIFSGNVFSEEVVLSADTIYGKTIGTVTQESKTLIDKLLNEQETKKMKRNLLLHYCDTLLHKEHAKDGNSLVIQYEDYLYDPKQSWFVYSLCVNIDEISKGRTIVDEKYKRRNYKKEFDTISYSTVGSQLKMNDYIEEKVDLNEDVWNIPNQASLDAETTYHACNPATSMQGCNIAVILPKIFSTIINDYSNMKLGSVFGYQMIDGKTVEQLSNNTDPAIKKAVEQFAKTYFGNDVYDKVGVFIGDKKMPCNDADITYLDPTDPTGESPHCAHPATYEFVANTLKSAKRLIDKTVLIDGEKVLKEECQGNERENLLMRCAFASWGDTVFSSDTKAFSNLLLNELMRYNLFVMYYTQSVLYDPSYHPLTMGSASFAYQKGVKEYTTMIYEQQLAKQSLDQMMRMISQIATNFPLHVGMSAYYEDIYALRKTVVKSYTPIHQLAYKRRNVQACMQ